jgi:hypothetical protein
MDRVCSFRLRPRLICACRDEEEEADREDADLDLEAADVAGMHVVAVDNLREADVAGTKTSNKRKPLSI